MNEHGEPLSFDGVACGDSRAALTWQAKVLAEADAAAIDGAAIVRNAEKFISDYVALPAYTALPLAIWAMATHGYEAFDAFPYLAVTSPTPRCGKTRLLEVLGLLVKAQQQTANISEAALFRCIEKFRPTLLLDEAETLRGKGERAEWLRGLVNAGNRSSASVIRCVGRDHDPVSFSVYCPKVIACIGAAPETISDRAIVIAMQRRRSSEKIERFIFRDAKAAGEKLAECMQSWLTARTEQIAAAYAQTDLSFLGDRDAEAWQPLFAVLAVADPERVPELADCARALCGAKAAETEDDSLAQRLLSDLQAIWPADTTHLPTADLLARLRAVEDSPWAGEVELTPRRLARMLRPFGIQPRQVRDGGRTIKGYTLAELRPAYDRYLASGCLGNETAKQSA